MNEQPQLQLAEPPPPGFPELRPFQPLAIESLRQGFKAGHRCQCLMAPTGSGKTLIAMLMIRGALDKGRRALFVCDRKTLINQSSAAADSYGLTEHGVIQADHWRGNDAPFQICSAQTLAQREWPAADLIIIDECFPAGTMISTPKGKKRIELMRSGDCIYNCCGESHVTSIFSTKIYATIRAKLSNGAILECTADHPVFTELGWQPASTLAIGSRLFCQEDVQALWGGNETVSNKGREVRARGTISATRMLRKILRQEIEEPNAPGGSSGEPLTKTKGYGAQTASARRKRNDTAKDSSLIGTATRGSVVNGIRGENAKKQSARVSAPLQDRHCESDTKDGSGNRRKESLPAIEKGTGQEERRSAEKPWVESVEVVQYRSGINVYNLRVQRHPSYFANGVLVHNCHTQLKVWTEHIQKIDAAVIGLSATPFAPGLGKLFSNLVNATTMHDLVESKVLAPLKIFSCTPTDMKGAATSGGEWTDRAAEERGLAIVGDVVSEWVKFGEGRKTIVFGATINHCEEIARQFNAIGVVARVFTCETKDAERAEILGEYRQADSKIRVLVSVEALAKGFDVPDVSCLVDCRPLRKSLSTAIQMWGRGMRSSPQKLDCRLLDHSNNIVRFAADFEDIYHNGLAALDDGEKLDKKIRREDEDEQPEAKGCPKCGYKPFFKHCVQCGHVKIAHSNLEVKPGEMREIMIGKTKLADDSRHLWEQVCTYARRHSAPEKQSGRAYYLFRDLCGTPPPSTWKISTTPDVPITKAVDNRIRHNNIRFIKGRRQHAQPDQKVA